MASVVRRKVGKFARTRFWEDEAFNRIQLDVGRYQQGPEHVQFILLTPAEARRIGVAMLKQAARANRLNLKARRKKIRKKP